MVSTAFAADTGIPSKPWAGANCIKYTIGNTVYAFNTNDSSSNSEGRRTAVNDAFLQNYPVTVSVASEVGFPPTNDLITCNVTPTPVARSSSPETFKTPWQVNPATP
jgi:hypothetical protein